MALFPLSDLLTTWADGISKALRVKSETQLTGRRIQRTHINADSGGTIPTSGSETIIVKPTNGYKARIIGLYLYIKNPGGTSGTHEFTVLGNSGIYFGAVGVIQALYSVTINFSYNDIVSGSIVNPSSIEMFRENLFRLEFTEANPLVIKYYNNTDADQVNLRFVRLTLMEEAIV